MIFKKHTHALYLPHSGSYKTVDIFAFFLEINQVDINVKKVVLNTHEVEQLRLEVIPVAA